MAKMVTEMPIQESESCIPLQSAPPVIKTIFTPLAPTVDVSAEV